jgi:SAM-dependent methyltransferase
VSEGAAATPGGAQSNGTARPPGGLARRLAIVRETWRHQGFSGVALLAVRNVPPLRWLMVKLMPERFKGWNELTFWKAKRSSTGFCAGNYAERFTLPFGIGREFFDGKRILDVGCGPEGSLEWADRAAERVGLDPLAGEYLALEASKHRMKYVTAPAEKMPFEDARFDVVASINSLDHVADVSAAVAEMKRVTRPGGRLLLVTDVNREPTVCEPHRLSWDVAGAFAPEFEVLVEKRLERGRGVVGSVLAGVEFDRSKGDERPGVLCVMFRKREAPPAGNP